VQIFSRASCQRSTIAQGDDHPGLPCLSCVLLSVQPYSATREVLPGAWQAELARLAAEGGDAAGGAPAEGPAAAAPGVSAAAPSPAASPGAGRADSVSAPAGAAGAMTQLQQKVGDEAKRPQTCQIALTRATRHRRCLQVS
jgi:hypothetical protein